MLWAVSIWIRTEPSDNVREYEGSNFSSFLRTNCTLSDTCLTVPLSATVEMVIGTGERRVGHLEEVNSL
jgi:hypothetical protein